ncbi:MAG: DNA polymerase III subunit gamma/tau [Candidatus Saccharibacteria bacterium]
MSKALYRKYRSKTLDEVIGQKHITDILTRAIATDSLSHAYLLTGPRGVGKTSVARILAHEINKLPYDETITNLDIIEIDAASNNGVEDVRDLREKVQIAPSNAAKKIYIIDEVHMLSKAAFNALLKTLEEPPSHVIFILATTNVEKLPATIISRAQRFSFRPITIDDAVKHLSYIAKQEKIKIDDEALRLIAIRSDGSFRDSISLLDQMSSLVDAGDKTITAKLIEDTLGLAPHQMIADILNAVESHDIPALVATLNGAFNEGVSPTVLVGQLTESIREQIADKPQLLPLLDAIIDVARSPQPQLKLISVLGMAATPKVIPKVAALLAPALEISVSIAELEAQAITDKPVEKMKRQKPALTINDEPQRVTVGGAAPDFASVSNARKSGADQPAGPAKTEQAPKTVLEKNINIAFDWDKLVEYTRQNYIALYSVLSKCSFELDGNTLTLYTANRFYKKKLDDTKYAPLLNKCLQDIGICELTIHTIPTTSPLKDSQAAAVAAIMGGGEEVSLESA